MLELPTETLPRIQRCDPVVEVMSFLSAQQLMRAFKVTMVTIRVWTESMGLPHIRLKGDGRDTIRYRREKVRDWSIRNKKKFDESVL